MFLFAQKLSLNLQSNRCKNRRITKISLRIGRQRNLARSYQRMSRSCLFLCGIFIVFMHLNVFEVNFPQQAVKFLLVPVVSIQHQRDYRENKKNEARNTERNFSCIAYTLFSSEATVWLRYRWSFPYPWNLLKQLQTLKTRESFFIGTTFIAETFSIHAKIEINCAIMG